jgi:hypothetical protein
MKLKVLFFLILEETLDKMNDVAELMFKKLADKNDTKKALKILER